MMMSGKILLRTPRPNSGESLLGFLLKVTQKNGYPSSMNLLRAFEVLQKRPSLEKVATLYGRDENNFLELTSYPTKDSNGRSMWSFYNHIVNPKMIAVNETKICTECVSQINHLPALWDLKFFYACPDHKRHLLANCPSCGKPFQQRRSGVLTCQCGYDFSKDRGEIVEDQLVLDVLDLIQLKAYNESLYIPKFLAHGYPIKELSEMSFGTLISLMWRLSNCKSKLAPDVFTDKPAHMLFRVRVLHDFLAQWPAGLAHLIESMPAKIRFNAISNAEKKYSTIKHYIIGSGLPNSEVQFIDDAFKEYADRHSKYDRLIEGNFRDKFHNLPRFGDIKGLAKHLGVDSKTAYQYVKYGIVKSRVISKNWGKSEVFDLAKIPSMLISEPIYNLSDAAKRIGLENQSLNYLKSKGIFKLQFESEYYNGISESDVVNFEEMLLNMAPLNKAEVECSYISLGKIMKMKSLGLLRAKFLMMYLDGSIKPIGRSTDVWQDIYFEKTMFMDFKKHH